MSWDTAQEPTFSKLPRRGSQWSVVCEMRVGQLAG
jgi:hypothetical protein